MNENQFYSITDLLEKHLKDKLEPEEQIQLNRWVHSSEENRAFFARIDNHDSLQQELSRFYEVHSNMRAKLERALPQLKEPSEAGLPVTHRIHFLRRGFFRYAAAIILILGAGSYLYYLQQQKKPVGGTSKPASSINEVAPGHEGAILTLADGRTVLLDSLSNGIVANQNGTQVLLNNGLLKYDAKNASDISYNTMTTPRGRQYQVILPDETKVWLNAASSIRYPTAFNGNERSVDITGEAYFEINKNKSKPFYVRANGMSVQVLGTSFNINAYKDEDSINTTLIEGAVRVMANDDASIANSVLLKPEQQAQIVQKDGRPARSAISVVNNANIEQVIAWKNGGFNFQDASLQEVMRQLSRWYDIEVVYEKGIPDIQFGGEISRNMKLSNLLKALDKTGVHFRLEKDRKLIVTP